MSRGAIIAFSIVGFIILVGLAVVGWWFGTYNKLVAYDQNVKQAWGEVETQYQRRYDLIPNLVATVKGYAKHESDVFDKVAEAQANIGRVNMTLPSNVIDNPQEFKRFEEAQNGLGNALSRLLAITEAYPDLKSNQNFLALQSQLEGTENRIAVARMRFNESVQSYNTIVQEMPGSIVASASGFHTRPYFEAVQAAAAAPKVKF